MTIKEKPTPKKGAKPARLPQSFAEAAADFEQSKILEIKRSRKIAWIIEVAPEKWSS